MKRPARKGARGPLWRVAAGVVCAAAFLGGTAQAQTQSQMMPDLPGQERLNPNIDPYPFDPFFALVHYFRQVLPTGWWAGPPVSEGGGYWVRIYVPAGWKGNPTSAVMRYCPDAGSSLWRNGIRRIEMRPFFHQVNWSSAVCRRPTG
ncbi:hypothetical protein ACI7BZ_02725 [Xanthobacter sp. AM11]|uniref:hypothetical protein n=1 Tax=Xanthobacter sp. AM11 TaxID=3380643 RepID=UPI0039BED8E6